MACYIRFVTLFSLKGKILLRRFVMKNMMTKSLNKLFFAISIVVVLSFTVGSIDARESSLIIK